MAELLKKGDEVALFKDGDNIKHFFVGIGWKQRGGILPKLFKSKRVDIDASAFMLNKHGRIRSKNDIIYFGNKSANGGGIIHTGDNKIGETQSDTDCECIEVFTENIPFNIERTLFVVNIYDCIPRRQDFGMISDAYVRVVEITEEPIDEADENAEPQKIYAEIARYNLTENYAGMTAIEAAEIVRVGDGWVFKAIGKGSKDASLAEITTKHR